MSNGIVLVGPVLPYRGGISHYNTLLFRQLRELDVSTGARSFRRQYPRWLYPGESDIDPTRAEHREDGVAYTIDSLNPLSWFRTSQEIAAMSPDLVVFHWWTIFWLPCFRLMIGWLKRRGIRTALVCHNLVDHDAGFLKATASRILLQSADAYLVHSSEHAREVAALCPGKPVIRHPHPVYDHYPIPKGTLSKRGRLELLFYGFIRPYKGLDVLIDALALLDDPEIHLTVVGEPWGDVSEIEQLASRAPNVELHLAYVSDAESAEYFSRADLVVLPYRTATGSGVASLAIGYEKPVLATTVGALPDVVIPGVNGFLVPPGDASALASTIAGTSREQLSTLAGQVQQIKEGMSWPSLAKAIRRLADDTCDEGGNRE